MQIAPSLPIRTRCFADASQKSGADLVQTLAGLVHVLKMWCIQIYLPSFSFAGLVHFLENVVQSKTSQNNLKNWTKTIKKTIVAPNLETRSFLLGGKGPGQGALRCWALGCADSSSRCRGFALDEAWFSLALAGHGTDQGGSAEGNGGGCSRQEGSNAEAVCSTRPMVCQARAAA